MGIFIWVVRRLAAGSLSCYSELFLMTSHKILRHINATSFSHFACNSDVISDFLVTPTFNKISFSHLCTRPIHKGILTEQKTYFRLLYLVGFQILKLKMLRLIDNRSINRSRNFNNRLITIIYNRLIA